MDRTKMLQVLGPAAGAAAVVVLVGVLIAVNDAPPASSAKSPSPVGEPSGDKSSYSGPPLPFPLDSPEWKDAAGGMKIWDVTEGSGEPCPPGATVTIVYTGWLTNGSEFDSSKKTGKPARFPLGNLIQGWQQGIPGMKPGGVRRLSIPPHLGYGAGGSPPKIPGNATIVFEIEMVSHQG